MAIDSIEISPKGPTHPSIGGISDCPSLDWVDDVWSPPRASSEPLRAYGGPPGGYGPPPGAPPGGGGYGGPPGAPPGGGWGGPPGAPPGGYGGPPGGGYGGPPGGGYGGPPGGGYGGPPGGGYGAPPAYAPAANPYGAQGSFGAAPMMGPMGMMGGGLGLRPPRRNASLVLWLTLAPIMAIFLIGGIIAATQNFALVGLIQLTNLASLVVFVFHVMACLDLKNVSNDPNFNWWFIFIPCLNMYALWVMIPDKVTQVKAMAGCPVPRRSFAAYFFLPAYALISDLNDLAA